MVGNTCNASSEGGSRKFLLVNCPRLKGEISLKIKKKNKRKQKKQQKSKTHKNVLLNELSTQTMCKEY